MSQTKAQLIDGKGSVDLGALSISGSAPNDSVNLDSSGRLLVGTSTARGNFYGISARIQSEAANDQTGRNTAFIYGRSLTDGPLLTFAKHRSDSVGGQTVVQSGDICGEIVFTGSDGTNFAPAAHIKAEVDGTPGANDMPGRLVFSTTADGASSPTERMRIRQDGLLLVNATSLDISSAHSIKSITNATSSTTTFASQTAALYLSASLGIQANSAEASNVLVLSGNSGLATNPGNLLRGYSGNGGTTLNVQIAANGNVTNTNNSYGAISDFNLKENIADASSQWGDLKSLRVRKYNFKEETGYSTHTQIGLVAQEVELVSPGLVDESIDEEAGKITKSVNYSVLYMKAVKALQEAMERIETLEAKVAALEVS